MNNKQERRQELVQQYKEMKTEAGVFQIRNTINGKIFIGSTRNLRTLNGKMVQLQLGTHQNKQLQQEWNEYGENNFTVEVLDTMKKKDDYYSERDTLKKLETAWLERLQPYGEQGYHKTKE